MATTYEIRLSICAPDGRWKYHDTTITVEEDPHGDHRYQRLVLESAVEAKYPGSILLTARRLEGIYRFS